MHLSKESATESSVIAFSITLLLRLPFIFESMCQGALKAAVALLVEGTEDENYFSIVSHFAPAAACLHALLYCCDEDLNSSSFPFSLYVNKWDSLYAVRSFLFHGNKFSVRII